MSERERTIDIARPQTLAPTAELAAASAAIVTHAGAGYQTRVKSILLHNHTANPRIATLRRVAAGGASGTANQFVRTTLAADQTLALSEDTLGKYGVILDTVGDALHGFADAINSVTITCFGIRV